MLSIQSQLDADETISPFSSFDQSIGGPKHRGMMNLIQSMSELKYITLNNKNQIELTNAGLKYLRQHGQKMKHLIIKYGITPVDYGQLANFFPFDLSSVESHDINHSKLSQLNDSNILGSGTRVDELGDQVDDYENIEFKDKAPGEMLN